MKTLLIVAFLLSILYNLGAGLYYMMVDRGTTDRTANAPQQLAHDCLPHRRRTSSRPEHRVEHRVLCGAKYGPQYGDMTMLGAMSSPEPWHLSSLASSTRSSGERMA